MPPAPARFSMNTDWPQSVAELVGEDAAQRVDTAAGRERNDQPDGMIRITFAPRAGAASASDRRQDQRGNELHATSPTPSRFRTSLPRILHRRRQDDNDDGAQRDRREAASGRAVTSHSQPTTTDSTMAQL